MGIMSIMGSILYFLFAVIMRWFKVYMVYMRNRSFSATYSSKFRIYKIS